MPGVVMDDVNIEGSVQRPGLDETGNRVSNSVGNIEKAGYFSDSLNGPIQVNGTSRKVDALNQQSKALTDKTGEIIPAEPFEIPHITQGFFPFGTLVNRAAQQCWNDISELITELASIQVSPQESPAAATGKLAGNQSSENVHKKVRLLEFAHAKRAEFIKLLVLSQWSRQAADVSRLIDLQGFIHTRYQAYAAALQCVGEMKRDLVRAQVANPDLKTALEVLSKGRVVSLPDLGYKRPKPLTARETLKILHKINRIIGVRLALHDQVPSSLRNYHVHDGRVTFTVRGEFELDLSVAEETKTSQFFFVDIRFLFSPSSPIAKGRIFNELDAKINDTLRDDGLVGCFDFLHGLVLTNKVSILFRQATDLARGLWSDSLRIELLHRTLVVQYWPLKPGPKSWLEIGVQSGLRNSVSADQSCRISHLGLRWMRDGQETRCDAIQFDSDVLSVERILRSVIAQHTSHLLSSAYTSLKKHRLFSNHALSLRAQLSPTEPGDCRLDIQLTASRHLRVSIEPMSGAIIVSGNVLERSESDRNPNKSPVEQIISRVSRLRCISAVEEIEFGAKALGLENIRQRGLGLDFRRIFPSNVLRSTFFTHQLWDRNWAAAATSSMDGDKWWLVQLPPAETTIASRAYGTSDYTSPNPPSAHIVSNTLVVPQRQLDYTACADLIHGLTGILAIYANARCLADVPGVNIHPSLENLQLGPAFEVPDLFFEYQTSRLPPAFRIALPSGLNKRSYLQDTVRLAFHGIDRDNQSTLLMACGTLRSHIKAFVPLISKMDSSIITQDNGGGFSLRLLVPAGRSVIIDLFERLQRLECILSILESLIRKGMEPRSLSLSQIVFTYGQDETLCARLDIKASGPSSSTHFDIAATSLKPKPLFDLRLGIDFDSPSPHRRIQEALTVCLNRSFPGTGVGPILGLMSITLPLLRSLDRITCKPSRPDAPVVFVTVRSPSTFQLRYPRLKSRFQLSATQHRRRIVWVLKDAHRSSQPNPRQVTAAIREKLYDTKGDGWSGLGDGAVATVDKVGNLILALHDIAGHLELNRQSLENEEKLDQPTAPQPGAKKQLPSGGGMAGKAKPEKPPLKAGPAGNTDIITID